MVVMSEDADTDYSIDYTNANAHDYASADTPQNVFPSLHSPHTSSCHIMSSVVSRILKQGSAFSPHSLQ